MLYRIRYDTNIPYDSYIKYNQSVKSESHYKNILYGQSYIEFIL